MNKYLKLIGAASLITAMVVFSGCGGGGGDDDDNNGGSNPPPVTGTSLDGKGEGNALFAFTATGAVAYTDNAATSNFVVINGFGADDKITITGATAANYNTAISSTAAGDVIISYNTGAATNYILLPGVAANAGIVYNVDTFNALSVGNLLFQ